MMHSYRYTISSFVPSCHRTNTGSRIRQTAARVSDRCLFRPACFPRDATDWRFPRPDGLGFHDLIRAGAKRMKNDQPIFASRPSFCACRSGGGRRRRLPGDSGMDRMRTGPADSGSASSARTVTALASNSGDRQGGAACRGLPRRVRRSSHDLPLPGSCLERLRRLVVLQCGGGDDAAGRDGTRLPIRTNTVPRIRQTAIRVSDRSRYRRPSERISMSLHAGDERRRITTGGDGKCSGP